MKSKLLTLGLTGVAAMASAAALAATNGYPDDNSPTGDPLVDASFMPYADGMPTFPGYEPGMVINQGNVDQFKDILTPGQYLVVKNGWYEMETRPTFEMILPKNFREATAAGYKNVSIDPKTGNLTGYVAGRPFPQEPSADDPKAGLKLAWNFNRGLNWGDNGTIDPFYFQYRDMESGDIDRELKLEYHTLNFLHRFQNQPIPAIEPNPANIYRGIYIKVSQPNALRNTQLLILRHEDATVLDDIYLYLGFQRRVRRLPADQTTDPFLGSDIMIQDFEGFNDRISAMEWSYLGTKNVLYPLYYHNNLELSDRHPEGDYKFVAFGGQGGCFPQIKWQLRKVHMVKAVPTSEASPIGHRVFFMDAQTGALGLTMIYDRKGQLWKVWIIGKTHPGEGHHLPINVGTHIPVDDSFAMIDLQAKHCTTGQFKGQIDPAQSPPHWFTTQYMRNVGGGN